MVSRTTFTRSSLRASKLASSLSFAEKASRVLAASYLRRQKRRSTRDWMRRLKAQASLHHFSARPLRSNGGRLPCSLLPIKVPSSPTSLTLSFRSLYTGASTDGTPNPENRVPTRGACHESRPAHGTHRPAEPSGGAGAHPTNFSTPPACALCPFCHNTTLRHYRLLSVTTNVTRDIPYSLRGWSGSRRTLPTTSQPRWSPFLAV
jgi:hypothetical protein